MMRPLTYDLHIHSCLSPCGDEDMIPSNIVGMATVKQLDVIAVTDHNSCKNCPAVMKLASKFGVIAIPGMELTTVEEVHVVCLFPELEQAMNFDQYVESRLIPIQNNPDIFGKQQIVDEDDEEKGTVPNLLINATTISFDQVYQLISQYHGVMIPAHIDKNSNSMIFNLGFVPPDSKFRCVELKDMRNLHAIKKSHPYIETCNVITNSDAHYLVDINEPVNTIHVQERSVHGVLEALK